MVDWTFHQMTKDTVLLHWFAYVTYSKFCNSKLLCILQKKCGVLANMLTVLGNVLTVLSVLSVLRNVFKQFRRTVRNSQIKWENMACRMINNLDLTETHLNHSPLYHGLFVNEPAYKSWPTQREWAEVHIDLLWFTQSKMAASQQSVQQPIIWC